MTQDKNQKGGFEQIGETLGGMAGQAAGRATDMAMNVAGTVMNSVFQSLGSWWSSPEAQQASRSFGDTEDSAFRAHFEMNAQGNTQGGMQGSAQGGVQGVGTQGGVQGSAQGGVQGSAQGGTRATRIKDYDRARPLYQFGHMARQNPDYQGKTFDQVEADLERAWAAAASQDFGDWHEVRDYVNYGYTHRSPGAPNPS